MGRLTKEEFAEWIQKNKTQMYRFAVSIVRNETDAEDVVCETIVKAYEHLDDLRDPAKLKSWMMAILYNVARTMCVKRKREVSIEEANLLQVEAANETLELWPMVMKLKPALRSVVILYYYTGYQTKEIAQILQIREGTVKSRLSRAREELRELIGK